MGALFTYPKFKATVGASGLPLSYGKVWTYEPGTTTLKPSYSDYACTTPNTNPVTLDVNGEATIFFSGFYRVKLMNAAGDQQWFLDNLGGSTAIEPAQAQNDFIIGGPSPTFNWTRSSFSDIKALFSQAYYAVDSGTTNAYEIALTPALSSYPIGVMILFKVTNTNTGNSTLDVDGLGPVTIKARGGVALCPGDLLAGQIAAVVYDGTYFQLLSPFMDLPVGAEIYWPTETPPSRFMEEDGSSLVITTYPILYGLLGKTYGGDATHFCLPDSRGRVVRVWAHGSTNDPDRASRTAVTASGATMSAGDHVGTEQDYDTKQHNHGSKQPAITVTARVYNGNAPGSGSGLQQSEAPLIWNSGPISVSATQAAHTHDNFPASGGNETRMINAARMLIMKVY